MIDKESILNSWIMVELLSEGDINVKKKEFINFDDLIENDFFSFFNNHVSKNRNPQKGIALYVDIFEFGDIIDFLRTKYKLSKPEEEIKYGSKFSFVIFFDKDLNFLSDLTFFTVSGYIKDKNEVPTLEEFHEFEKEQKTKLEQYFEITENDADVVTDNNIPNQNLGAKKSIDSIKFNKQVERALSLISNKINLKNCRIKIINNIESDAVNLHSFFVEDLERAKNISTTNLDSYLLGFSANRNRINLDSKKGSSNFNHEAIKKILMPQNYPLGRFPSNTKYALSFMQQIAVNLSIGLDSSQIRSVNGPPGTGKTTLLKDIFAELIVKQAYDICRLSTKKIRGSEETIYYEKASIGMIPDNIAENSIVVASSNNGAVQNIVNELPLLNNVSEDLVDEIKKMDYFQDIANSTVQSDWSEDGKNIRIKPNEALYWGLFSLEGGKSENMKKILERMGDVVQYFYNGQYEENPNIYKEFNKQYLEVKDYRDRISQLLKDKNELISLIKVFKEKQEKILSDDNEKKRLQADLDTVENESAKIKEQIDEKNQDCDRYKAFLDSLEKEKPGFFTKLLKRSKSQEFEKRKSEAQNDFTEVLKLKKELDKQRTEIREEITKIKEKIKIIDDFKERFYSWGKAASLRKEELENNTAILKEVELDLTQPYDKLQLSNPWFNEEYRILQSKLFIAALSVRKQFLYENKKNIKAACIVWSKQNDYLEKKQVISAAWRWINITIPVISSTFASFGKMCKNLGENSLGHLFIDEAGQALPQASVGAIFRSKHVMAVGDPAQIKPVLTLEPGVLGILKTHFNVSEKYLSDSASTQTLVDAVSQYGYYRDSNKSDSSWIGIPLWVHRRCQYPMFTISNKISYNDMMVQGNPGDGKTGWYDIKGKANNKYVKEQGVFLLNKIQEMINEDPKIVNKDEKDTVYIISPFANVAFQLAKELDKIHFTRRDGNGKPTNIGTIHTFQGKEAPIVFMVLGADSQSIGAAAWAVAEPNMMNVAATRAKQEFYIVGDKELYLNLGSDITKNTYSVIMQYKKDHPDLVVEAERLSVTVGKETKQPFNVDKNELTYEKNIDVQDNLNSLNALKHEESRYIGNRLNKTFHCVTCKYAPKNPQKRVVFFTREEALENGFTPCKTCNA